MLSTHLDPNFTKDVGSDKRYCHSLCFQQKLNKHVSVLRLRNGPGFIWVE